MYLKRVMAFRVQRKGRLFKMLNELMNVLGSSATAVDLAAALCLLTGVDPTLLPLSATTGGRVLSSMGRLAAQGYGSIQTFTATDGAPAVPAVPICNESHVPADLEAALVGAGVEPDVLASMYFDERHGQAFRQRIKSKWRTFAQLVSKGLIASPTGFFVSAVRKNWHLSSTYEPGKKKAAPLPDAPALPAAGSLVRVAGDLGRLCRVVSHRRSGGEWKTLLDDDGATLEVSSRKVRAGAVM